MKLQKIAFIFLFLTHSSISTANPTKQFIKGLACAAAGSALMIAQNTETSYPVTAFIRKNHLPQVNLDPNERRPTADELKKILNHLEYCDGTPASAEQIAGRIVINTRFQRSERGYGNDKTVIPETILDNRNAIIEAAVSGYVRQTRFYGIIPPILGLSYLGAIINIGPLLASPKSKIFGLGLLGLFCSHNILNIGCEIGQSNPSNVPNNLAKKIAENDSNTQLAKQVSAINDDPAKRAWRPIKPKNLNN